MWSVNAAVKLHWFEKCFMRQTGVLSRYKLSGAMGSVVQVFIFCSLQGFNFVEFSSRYGQLPVCHEFVRMQRHPRLHQLVLFARKCAKFTIRNLEDCLSLCKFHVNVRHVVSIAISAISVSVILG